MALTEKQWMPFRSHTVMKINYRTVYILLKYFLIFIKRTIIT